MSTWHLNIISVLFRSKWSQCLVCVERAIHLHSVYLIVLYYQNFSTLCNTVRRKKKCQSIPTDLSWTIKLENQNKMEKEKSTQTSFLMEQLEKKMSVIILFPFVVALLHHESSSIDKQSITFLPIYRISRNSIFSFFFSSHFHFHCGQKRNNNYEKIDFSGKRAKNETAQRFSSSTERKYLNSTATLIRNGFIFQEISSFMHSPNVPLASSISSIFYKKNY